MKQRIITFLLFVAVMTSCGTIGNDLMGAYNMTQCEYSYKSISGLTLSGINLSNGVTAANALKLTSVLAGKSSSIPLNFTINMNVKNPNQSAAMLNNLQYNIKIDGVNLTNGVMNQNMNIPAGNTSTMPLTIGVDVASLIKDNTQSSVVNIVKNFVGIGSEKSNVTVELKPSFNIGGQTIASPNYIPVSFSFGGNKK
ncbi:LEA14-like dessication related protein [Dysgonomonas sp. PH5-45]|uniref:NDR1/HIN1-like protein n=1 Tax=unclassified Dysgonomonas TaxID=2630389 RepID=UPI0024740AD6|nr:MULTISPECIES: LEA type 2 family protein [unclassified Dysgonomonas]MDH6355549.1 LEA14-like dessication related protein [Dysgonomonas sp. PH5-45]MDH6388446.1 LEA14-like dessication related protein [Dysgonomonas sp. PH5-37]